MRAAWTPPCLDYTPEYLEWQLSFPGAIAPRYITGFQDGRCVAFAAATPRKLRLGSWSAPFFVKSFVTIAPHLRGRGIGRDLRRRIVSEIAAEGIPIVRFGEIATGALEEDYQLSGMAISYQGECRAVARLSDANAEPRLLSIDEYLNVTRALSSPRALVLDADAEVVAHYSADPRGRAFLGVSGEGGEIVAAGMAVKAMVVTRKGSTTSVQLEQPITARDTEPRCFRDLTAAAARWGYNAAGIVTIPNTGSLEPGLLAEAGYRHIPGRYRAWVANPVGMTMPFQSVTLDLEII